MSASFQYKVSLGGTATDVPVAAWPRDDGALYLKYPEAVELDGLGQACGAIGKPQIIFKSPELTGTGMAFWQGLFATSTTESMAIWLTVFNPRSGTWQWWTGTLSRPKFDDVAPGVGAANTIYRNVEIRVIECEAVV